MKARQHPNMIQSQKALLHLWHQSTKDADVNLNQPVMYVDRLRIRSPGDQKFTLPPHVDGGGIERWKDENYRAVYRKLLQGKLDDFDPFEIDNRVLAAMTDSGYDNGCTFFRY